MACQSIRNESFSPLESLDAPAALVDRDLIVLSANSKLSNIAVALQGDLLGLKIGEVLECSYASWDHRCGEAAQCDSCGVKRIIDIARISGEKLRDLPTGFRNRHGDRENCFCSAENMGDSTILMIRKCTDTNNGLD